jgi:ABC-type Mn2+/Zn2+ transport system permease subunit
MSFLISLSDFWQYDFLFKALLATIALALATGVLSPIIVSKRYSFMGAAVSHSTLFGLSISLTFLNLASEQIHFLVTLVITLLFALFLARETLKKELPSDSLIGIFFSVMMALGIIIYSFKSEGQEDLVSFLFGNILLLTSFDVILLIIIAALTLLIISLYFSSWIYFIFDPLGARLRGIKTSFLHYLLFIIMTTLIVTAIKLAGTVLVTTLLILPGAFSLHHFTGSRLVFIYSTLFALLTATLGLTISNWLGTPSGATLALTQFLIFTLSLMRSKKV